jgi:thymidylate kinase
LSAVKLVYLLGDYSTVYLWKCSLRLRQRSTLVIFDRYYHDILVDPKRYRYGASIWLARQIGHLVPNPDLWILLDATPELIRSRKQEVTFEEMVRQCKEYRELVGSFRNAVIVDASLSLDEVVQTVKQSILEHGTKLSRRRDMTHST